MDFVDKEGQISKNIGLVSFRYSRAIVDKSKLCKKYVMWDFDRCLSRNCIKCNTDVSGVILYSKTNCG